ncbi:DUF6171 family protein [Lachnobacterium bovis]|uniref:Uncharacterized protein n=1 Tax=Lachnobacterium bovis TaxID=140626 RepID=A0A1H9UFT9_9FIRM|nr:DUF6171 family protein [Lachnobacterium bovis]SES07913.1 hypothetical protein SAMN02910429_02075 [Lachnobacterium bovis]
METKEETRYCRQCLLMDQAREGREKLDKYLSIIKKQDKTDEREYLRRLDLCRKCEKLVDATCSSCGCYVEFRAAVKHGKCPNNIW